MLTRKQDVGGQEARTWNLRARKGCYWKIMGNSNLWSLLWGVLLGWGLFGVLGRAYDPFLEISIIGGNIGKEFDRLLLGVCSTLRAQEKTSSIEKWLCQWDFPLPVKLGACQLSSWQVPQYRGRQSPSLPYPGMMYILLSELLGFFKNTFFFYRLKLPKVLLKIPYPDK